MQQLANLDKKSNQEMMILNSTLFGGMIGRMFVDKSLSFFYVGNWLNHLVSYFIHCIIIDMLKCQL